ncbi:unnamed protein product [Vicia faba]|uniref:Uncharacterized protein n=1 Tax=Vicia faba TaxID=3906 RepID=A0AAV1AF26_VICFA|nr:unnamed protein product [Vicia faba]
MRFLSSSAFVKKPTRYTLSTAAMDAIHQDSFTETVKLQYGKHYTLFYDSNHPHSFSEYSKMASDYCIRTVLNFEEIAKIGSFGGRCPFVFQTHFLSELSRLASSGG